MPKFNKHFLHGESGIIFYAGIALAVGAFGITIASLLYALTPVEAALPIPNPNLSDAFTATKLGHETMKAAGVIGIIFDIVFMAATLVLLAFRKPKTLSVEPLGWAFVTLSVLMFVVADALAATALPRLALGFQLTDAFIGFKLLFDIFFVMGSISFGLGGSAIFISELRAQHAPRPLKVLMWSGLLFALAGLISGLLYIMNVSLPLVMGAAILGGGLIFCIYGVHIANSTRRLQ
ncbi:MAG TPA: hypothetical protein VK497_06210 [Candidatus Saccharimonadales bacterium]|nr:hypothetical protein [Candidatus Saccharimonadales bacterium]